ncbi:MAG TPA: hypothetical protein PK995_09660 [Bacteroidia bacterium]|nr:hypothetical protein [Bacteroidia bacterium]
MFRIIIIYLFLPLVYFAQSKKNLFKQTQLNYPVVKSIYDKHWKTLVDSMKIKKISPDSFNIYFRVLKYEKILEVWIKNSGEPKYQLFKTFYLCATSGNLGPKKYNKDGQIPEGFYEITNFNPKDKYKYLALKINFPNAVDRAIAEEPITTNVFIHGTCETTCDIVLDKEDMEQLYILCVEAKNRKESLYIDIFPCHFIKENEEMLLNFPKRNIRFWSNIKDAYLYFEEHHWLPRINTNNKGQYIFEE